MRRITSVVLAMAGEGQADWNCKKQIKGSYSSPFPKKGDALQQAVTIWRTSVIKRHPPHYAHWPDAKHRSLPCKEVSVPAIDTAKTPSPPLGAVPIPYPDHDAKRWRCRAIGNPCAEE